MAVASTTLPVRRLDAELYGRIVASGALDSQRVELIDGIIVEMSPHSLAHSLVIERLTRLLMQSPERVRPQLSLHVAADSVPEPDLALVEGPELADRHPTTALLVVEVAVSSQTIDRGRKAELYAAAGIPTYWLIDVPLGAVETRTDPGPAGYRTLRTFEHGESLPAPGGGVGAVAVGAVLDGL